jgi:hypothetical protein
MSSDCLVAQLLDDIRSPIHSLRCRKVVTISAELLMEYCRIALLREPSLLPSGVDRLNDPEVPSEEPSSIILADTGHDWVRMILSFRFMGS